MVEIEKLLVREVRGELRLSWTPGKQCLGRSVWSALVRASEE
jgi:hypothetical protein